MENNKIKVEVIARDGLNRIIECGQGDNLMRVLQKADYDIYAPCGGNGTCGKCQVELVGNGMVSSCNYQVKDDIQVRLAAFEKVKILTAMHDYCLELTSDCCPKGPAQYGVAIDIGTTTLALYFIKLNDAALLETKSAMNPQTRYGADVISRITFCNSDLDKVKELQTVLVNLIDERILRFCTKHNIDKNSFTRIFVAANPTMLHFLMGEDPMPIAMAPFTPAFLEEQIVEASSLGFLSCPEAKLRTLPSISAYVGADIVAGLASIRPSSKYKNYILLDIGTNGEMCLVTKDKIYCCATAAGPAFEGGNIECGMGAFSGAISEFTSLEKFKTIANSTPIGICGSGLIDIINYLVESETIGADGNLEEDFVIYENKSSGKKVYICQQDIREIQLAKSAIVSGVNILVNKSGLSYDDIDLFFLAGGFGNFINVDSAMKIGLIPSQMKGKIVSLGNTSGAGAVLSLGSDEFNGKLQNVIDKAHYIELSTEEDFLMEYAMNMSF